ncbi:hypothetical protein [Sorangium sp. So ce341]|uniref:hypothetical protein n=1 Tax=Sorangium sp. So ce341 TaxID=3133302 RepID=UPI003F642DFF
MTQYIIRLAVQDDKPAIRCLQGQFMAEIEDPLELVESDFDRSDFILVEAVDGSSRRAVGMMSIMRASSAPFVFERVLPDVWQRIDVRALTGRADLRREDLVEVDWLYLEKPHRAKQLTRLLMAGGVLQSHRRGYPVIAVITNAASKVVLLSGLFHGSGLAIEIGGVPYELGTVSPAQSAAFMADFVQSACARDPLLAWHLDGS